MKYPGVLLKLLQPLKRTVSCLKGLVRAVTSPLPVNH